MSGKENTRPTVGAAGREAETEAPVKMTTASTRDHTTIGGSGQIVRRELIRHRAAEILKTADVIEEVETWQDGGTIG